MSLSKETLTLLRKYAHPHAEVMALARQHASPSVPPPVSPGKANMIEELCHSGQQGYGSYIKLSTDRLIRRMQQRVRPVSPRLIFDNFPHYAIGWIHRQHGVVGCVAWLSRYEIMAALQDQPWSMIVVQREKHLKGWATVEHPAPRSLYAFYQGTNPQFKTERYRAFGDIRSRGRLLMHHKFLVGFQRRWGGPLIPASVWYGSWNMTRNSGESRDSAIMFDNEDFAHQCCAEWLRIWQMSKPLQDG